MLLVRCFSCGKVISASYDEFKERTEKGEDPGEVLDDLGIHKYCCRRMFISHVDVW
ncbi:MAG: DNA-directed RNA polymerase subunit N [Methanosphaera stadtmanae]|jgi:DNA-directed RNA polymerase subunit N|nr:DNA-directed RNA polymerase subunit N [Methanosphaera stadtmanae]